MDFKMSLVNALGAYFDAARKGDEMEMERVAASLERGIKTFDIQSKQLLGAAQLETTREEGRLGREFEAGEGVKEREFAAEEGAKERVSREKIAGIRAAGEARGLQIDPLTEMEMETALYAFSDIQKEPDPAKKKMLYDAAVRGVVETYRRAYQRQGLPFDEIAYTKSIENQFGHLLTAPPEQPEGQGLFSGLAGPEPIPGAPPSAGGSGLTFSDIIDRFRGGGTAIAQTPPTPQVPSTLAPQHAQPSAPPPPPAPPMGRARGTMELGSMLPQSHVKKLSPKGSTRAAIQRELEQKRLRTGRVK
ncbi:MAG: hypothetical protein JSW41_02620 [Candidatus Aenigmatarchaeota archaeon]|nr:MAG: hypothetical protein JSW41_02620 [Candidatus Aenigmarchaeota archaeon]